MTASTDAATSGTCASSKDSELRRRDRRTVAGDDDDAPEVIKGDMSKKSEENESTTAAGSKTINGKSEKSDDGDALRKAQGWFEDQFKSLPHLLYGPRQTLPLALLALIYALNFFGGPLAMRGYFQIPNPETGMPDYISSSNQTDRMAALGTLLARAGDGASTTPAPAGAIAPYITSPDVALLVYFVGSLWGSVVLLGMFCYSGWWPITSFTMQSWSYATLRCLLNFVLVAMRKLQGSGAVGNGLEGASGSSTFYFSTLEPALMSLAEFFRFPSMAQNIVTCVIWWMVLVPLITSFIYIKEKKDHSGQEGPEMKKDRSWEKAFGFVKWNFNPFLFNVHFLNMVLACFDQLFIIPRAFNELDLWFGLCVGLTYLLFYLTQLDARGIHFYIILNPRTNWSAVSYLLVLGMYFGMWVFWNSCVAGTYSVEMAAGVIS